MLACILVALPAHADKKRGSPAQRLLTRAEQEFDDQRYEESIQTLSAALVRPQSTREERISILRLLALNYITLGQNDEAESAIRGLLVLQPDYELPESESPRFRDVFVATKKKWDREGRPGLVVRKQRRQDRPVRMSHASPSQLDPGEPVTLKSIIDDPDGRISEVRLYYRTGSQGKFKTRPTKRTGKTALASIPPGAVKPPLVEYYFQAVDERGLPVIGRGDADAPLRIAVRDSSGGWVVPVAIGGGVLGAGAIVGGLALAGVFSSDGGDNTGPGRPATVTVTVRE